MTDLPPLPDRYRDGRPLPFPHRLHYAGKVFATPRDLAFDLSHGLAKEVIAFLLRSELPELSPAHKRILVGCMMGAVYNLLTAAPPLDDIVKKIRLPRVSAMLLEQQLAQKVADDQVKKAMGD